MQQEIILILILTTISCALTGSFLVLRKMSMITDAITHRITRNYYRLFCYKGFKFTITFYISNAIWTYYSLASGTNRQNETSKRRCIDRNNISFVFFVIDNLNY